MYWYLRTEHPRDMLNEVARLDNIMVRQKDGALKSKFELMPGEERVKLVKQMQVWDQNAGKYLFYPNDKSYWYILQPHMIKGISAGNQSGKTTTDTIDVVSQIEGWHPLQRKNLEELALKSIDPKVRDHCSRLMDERKWIPSPPIEARCVSVDYGFVERVNGPKYVMWASKGELKYVGFDNEKKRKIIWKDGSYVEFMTHEQDAITHGGAARHVIQFDEEGPKHLYDEALMRISSVKGRILYSCTGLEGVTWSDEAIWIPGLMGTDPDIYAIEMSTYDNPVQTEAMINRIKKQCATEQDVQIRIYGKRVRKGGSVYDMAQDEEPWVIPDIIPPKEKGILVFAADIHPKTEQALLWAWVDYEGEVDLGDGDKSFPLRSVDGELLPNVYEVAEKFEHANVQQMDFIIKNVEEKLGRKHDHFLLEPAAWNDDQNKSAKPVAAQFVSLGYWPMKASKNLSGNALENAGGILEVKKFLTVKDFITGEDYKYPRLFTCASLERLRWERKNYHYPRPPKGIDMPIKQKPVDKDDHLMEDERRIIQFVVDHEMEFLEQSENGFTLPDGTVIELDEESTFNAALGE